MKGIAADINIQKQARILNLILSGEEWRGVWEQLHLEILSIQELGLDATTPDDTVWLVCQQQELVLLTANRNHEGPRSLEAAIGQLGTPTSLPVLTLADSDQVIKSRAYAERVVEQMLDYLMDIDNLRGSGRLYLP